MNPKAAKAWLLVLLFVASTMMIAGSTQTTTSEKWTVLEKNNIANVLPNNASNNEGYLAYMVMGYSVCETEVYGIDDLTFMSLLQCPGYTLLRTLAQETGIYNEEGGDVDLLNISGWNVNDAAYLGNGEHLISLSKTPFATTGRSIFNETTYDGYSHLIGKMDSAGELSAVGGGLTFSHDRFSTAFDANGNLFLQGLASNKSESPFIAVDGTITSLDWITIGDGPACETEMDFAPSFLTYFNRSTNRFSWLFQSPFLQPQPHATSEAIEGTFLYSTIGTPAQTFDCGAVPGTHSFGQHTASAGEILTSVSSAGDFHYAHNTGVTNMIANSKVQVGVGQHGYVYQSGYSNAQHLVSNDGIKTLASNHPFVCERQNETAYMYHGSPWFVDSFIWNQNRPYHHVDMSEMPDYIDPQSGRCVANHEALIFRASWIPSWSTIEMSYWSAFSQNSDDDWLADAEDAFPYESTQWRDTDNDGRGDNWGDPLWNNTMEGNNPNGRWVENAVNADACPTVPGTSIFDRIGCPDNDGDMWSDEGDAFDYDHTQWNDTDGDGFGDNPIGSRPDGCIYDYGTSSRGIWGCQDSDGDGWPDQLDVYPGEISQWNDTDGDGFGDSIIGLNGDACPQEGGTSFKDRWGCPDTDGDGWSDKGDAFPTEATQYSDQDNDGYGDNQSADAFETDAFPFDPTQQIDTDGDGFGDNQRGSGADKFPEDPTQWSDIDGDGYGDNTDGNAPDAFIADPTQWSDADGDGYGDNPTGRLADAFSEEGSQWEDQDGDGLGDNQSGVNPDPFLFDFDNDGYNDSIDPLPKLASPGDVDADGYADNIDWAPFDYREWLDSDGDGEGDNADLDDDNDGWTDTDEARQGTDPFSSESQPVEGFEVIIPGTQISLGAWDLIGMFGGIPLFIWIAFGFVTRNGRTARFEHLLAEATTREELEKIANQWEYSLMLRLIGPHQGIRLERIRTELDDRLEAELFNSEQDAEMELDQTHLVERELNAEMEKTVPELASNDEDE
jgi:hypothetical protein